MTETAHTSTRVRGCCQPLATPLPARRADDAAAIPKALADPTRLQMMRMLSKAAEPVCVCDFTAAFDLGQPTVSHHLGKLRDAGLVTSSKHGIWAFYELSRRMPAIASAVLADLG